MVALVLSVYSVTVGSSVEFTSNLHRLLTLKGRLSRHYFQPFPMVKESMLRGIRVYVTLNFINWLQVSVRILW